MDKKVDVTNKYNHGILDIKNKLRQLYCSYIALRSASIWLYTNRTHPNVLLISSACSLLGYIRYLQALFILSHLDLRYIVL